jgi:hypothetical protein
LAPERRRILEGIIVPSSWTAPGKIIELTLNTFDECEYRINDPDLVISSVMKHLGNRVRVVGMVTGNLIIKMDEITDLAFPWGARQNEPWGEKKVTRS